MSEQSNISRDFGTFSRDAKGTFSKRKRTDIRGMLTSSEERATYTNDAWHVGKSLLVSNLDALELVELEAAVANVERAIEANRAGVFEEIGIKYRPESTSSPLLRS
jgi:hypothetical protein